MTSLNSAFSDGHITNHSNIPGLREYRKCYTANDEAEMQELLNRVQKFNKNMRREVQKIINYKQIDSKLYVDWEAIDGVSLDEAYCKNHKQMTLEDILDCLRQIIRPLILMHGQGIAHHNIQPGTIWKIKQLDADQHSTAQQSEYKLVDWHLSKASIETYGIDSYSFLAPEIFDTHRGQPGTAADMYALAATLYILHTGQSPFDKTETLLTQIRKQHLEEMPTLQRLPAALRPVFLWALSKDPRDRPTMHQFLEEFERAYREILAGRTRPRQPGNIMMLVMTRKQAIIFLATFIGFMLALGIERILSWLLGLPWRPAARHSVATAQAKVGIGGTILTFTEHQAVVKAAMPSSDGIMAVSADESGRLMVWSISSGKVLLDDLDRHAGASIVGVAWAPGNQVFASLDVTGLVWLWRLQDEEYRPFASHRLPTPTRGIAWSTIGNHLVVASGNCLAIYDYVPDYPFGMPDFRYKGHSDVVNSVVISRDGKFAVSGSNDDTVQVWDIETAQQKFAYRGHTAEVSAVAISPDGWYIASGGEDQTVQVWDAQGEIGGVQFAYRHSEAVRSVAWSLDGQSLASGGDDKVVHVYDNDGTWRYTYPKHKAGIASVAWLPDGHRIVSASGSEVHVWRAL